MAHVVFFLSVQFQASRWRGESCDGNLLKQALRRFATEFKKLHGNLANGIQNVLVGSKHSEFVGKQTHREKKLVSNSESEQTRKHSMFQEPIKLCRKFSKNC